MLFDSSIQELSNFRSTLTSNRLILLHFISGGLVYSPSIIYSSDYDVSKRRFHLISTWYQYDIFSIIVLLPLHSDDDDSVTSHLLIRLFDWGGLVYSSIRKWSIIAFATVINPTLPLSTTIGEGYAVASPVDNYVVLISIQLRRLLLVQLIFLNYVRFFNQVHQEQN